MMQEEGGTVTEEEGGEASVVTGEGGEDGLGSWKTFAPPPLQLVVVITVVEAVGMEKVTGIKYFKTKKSMEDFLRTEGDMEKTEE